MGGERKESPDKEGNQETCQAPRILGGLTEKRPRAVTTSDGSWEISNYANPPKWRQCSPAIASALFEGRVKFVPTRRQKVCANGKEMSLEKKTLAPKPRWVRKRNERKSWTAAFPWYPKSEPQRTDKKKDQGRIRTIKPLKNDQYHHAGLVKRGRRTLGLPLFPESENIRMKEK